MPEPVLPTRQGEIGWTDARRTIEDFDRVRAVPDSDRPDGIVSHPDFSGHKGIYLANLEGYLGGRFSRLLRERDGLVGSLLAVCGFEWNDAHGCFLDADGARYDEPQDALDEAIAMVHLGYRAVEVVDP